MRPATNAQVGSGVPRTRLSRPLSRSSASRIAMLTRLAETTARVMIPGT